jgi:hypothetical protein
MVGRNVAVKVGVRVGGTGETPGSNVGGISVGPSVFKANGSRVGVDEGKLVTVGRGVSVGPTVAGVRKERSMGRAEHPVMMRARRSDKVFFTIVLYMVPQKNYWDYCINCIRFEWSLILIFTLRPCLVSASF